MIAVSVLDRLAPPLLASATVEALQRVLLTFGAGWVMWLLGLLSLTGMALSIERWLHLRRRTADLSRLAAQLHGWLSAGELQLAVQQLEREDTVAAGIAAAGIRMADRGREAAAHAMTARAALERESLERGLTFVGTLGNNAPFVGLFGTVIGVIAAFDELGHVAPGHGAGSVAEHSASQGVMAGISEALVATAVGIAVALPAVAAYNALQRQITGLLAGSEVCRELVLAYLPAGGSDARVAGPPSAAAGAASRAAERGTGSGGYGAGAATGAAHTGEA